MFHTPESNLTRPKSPKLKRPPDLIDSSKTRSSEVKSEQQEQITVPTEISTTRRLESIRRECCMLKRQIRGLRTCIQLQSQISNRTYIFRPIRISSRDTIAQTAFRRSPTPISLRKMSTEATQPAAEAPPVEQAKVADESAANPAEAEGAEDGAEKSKKGGADDARLFRLGSVLMSECSQEGGQATGEISQSGCQAGHRSAGRAEERQEGEREERGSSGRGMG